MFLDSAYSGGRPRRIPSFRRIPSLWVQIGGARCQRRTFSCPSTTGRSSFPYPQEVSGPVHQEREEPSWFHHGVSADGSFSNRKIPAFFRGNVESVDPPLRPTSAASIWILQEIGRASCRERV